MAEQTLDVRDQTLEGEVFQKDQKNQKNQKNQKIQKDQKFQKVQKDQKLDGVQWPNSGGSEITSRYTRARMRILQEFCVFCYHKCHINSITHYVITVYIDFRNNIPHCHTFTLLLSPKKIPKHHPQNNFSTSNQKQHVVFSKTTRCFQQNDTSFSVKRYVVFGMMKYFQFHPL